MRRFHTGLLLTLSIVAFSACRTGTQSGDASDVESASVKQVRNFHKFDDSTYRSGHPETYEFYSIKRAGIKTVLSLEDYGGNSSAADQEKYFAEKRGLNFIWFPMSPKSKPTLEQVQKTVAYLTDAGNQPILVHCHYGDDRTGIAVAAYRIAHDHWTAAQARDELRQMGHYQALYWWDDILDTYAASLHQSNTNPNSNPGSVGTSWPVVPRMNGLNLTKTPGEICTTKDPDYSTMRYSGKVAYCNRNVTNQEKIQIGASYGIKPADFSKYEFDHLIPLSIGGNNTPKNIWPQPLGEAHEKDKAEFAAYKAISSGGVSQMEAIKQVLIWRASSSNYIYPAPSGRTKLALPQDERDMDDDE